MAMRFVLLRARPCASPAGEQTPARFTEVRPDKPHPDPSESPPIKGCYHADIPVSISLSRWGANKVLKQ